jgi:hypothetical protein
MKMNQPTIQIVGNHCNQRRADSMMIFITIAIEVFRKARGFDGEPGHIPPAKKIPIVEILAPKNARPPQSAREMIAPLEAAAEAKKASAASAQNGSKINAERLAPR